MAKKRVHELAKQFGLDNKEVITLLQKAGISVKTHSSSVDEGEALKILGDAAPASKTESEPKKKRMGMKIRRKAKVEQPKEPEPPEVQAEQVAQESAQHAAPAVVEPSIEAPEAKAATTACETEVDTDVAVTAPGASASEAVAAPVAQEVAAVQEETKTEPAAQQKSESAPGPGVDGAPAAKPKPKTTGATVVRMIDRSKLLERVPSNRLGGSDAGHGGGNRSFGKVTELKVVNDPFGRGREMVAVNRDKKSTRNQPAKRPGGQPARRGRQGMRERSQFPSRLRRKKVGRRSASAPTPAAQLKASKRVIKMNEEISVTDLAMQLRIRSALLLSKMISLGSMHTINDTLDFDTVQLIAAEYDYTVVSQAFDEGEFLSEAQVDGQDTANWIGRPPVVTIMGHVDHGKTSLLDVIRKTKVTEGESGGITQHIGAYSVVLPKRGSITFLDTPGHAAFTEMRARGANVTDIVVLVVAADDGVMPQTEEAIRHAQAAGVPLIVAVNKVDLPNANPERVMKELANFDLLPEAWGGDTLYIETSATQKTGIDELLDALLLQADVLELSANPDCNANGTVLEARLDKGRGPVATILVQHGTLNRGDYVVLGEQVGKVRAMADHTGKNVKEAGICAAVEIIGIEGVPQAGDSFSKVDTADQARDVAEHRLTQRKGAATVTSPKASLEDLMRRMNGEEAQDLNVVIKADVQGSVEAVRGSLEKLSNDEVRVNTLFGAVGAIRESDIMLAGASQGLILGFNVRPDAKARSLAQREGVEIRIYSVIYEMIDDVTKAMEGMLDPDSREKVIGRADVRDLFRISKVGTIAGCRVVDGKAVRSARVRVLRDSVQIYDGKVSSLKHFKDDAREVETGLECGIGVEGFNDIKPGDAIEFYEVETVSRTLNSAPIKRSKTQPEARA